MSYKENWIKTHKSDNRQAAKQLAGQAVKTGVYERVDNRTHRELKPNELPQKSKERKQQRQQANVLTQASKVAKRSSAIATYMRIPPYYTLEVSDAQLDIIQLAIALLAAEKHPGASELSTYIATQKAQQRTVKNQGA